MKVCTILIIITLLSQPLTAKDGLHFGLSPSLSRGFGHTTYTMDNVYIVDSNGIVQGTAKSQLEFPLDAFYAGVESNMYYEKSGRREWFVKAGYFRNVNEPSGLMKDHDWIIVPGYSDFKWSYTESNVDFKYHMITFQVGRWIFGWSKANSYAVLGFMHQKIVQDVIDIKGWQYDISTVPYQKYPIDITIRALYYKVTYNIPMAGVLYNIQFSPQAYCDITAAYMHVFASDVDDHILRNKLSKAKGTGPGLFSSIEGHLALKIPNSDLMPFIGIEAKFLTSKVSSGQTQEWYGDDPITENYDDTGDIIENVPHEFTSLQFSFGIKIGLAF
jgi:hypothetical protein